MSENTKTVLQAFAADILATEADRIRQIEMHRKAKADHDALFVTLPKLFDRCLPFVKGSHSSAREAVFKVLRSDGTPLFCRWATWHDWKDGRDERDWHPDDARWTPLPPCPVECFSRSRECSGGLHTAQTYTYTASPGTITTPDPLAAACGQDDGPGRFLAGALAIRREDADRLFGPAVPASAAPEPPAPVAVAPETAPSASINPLPRAQWKEPRNNRWTKAAKDQMHAMRAAGHTDARIAEAFGLKQARQVGNLICSRAKNKIQANEAAPRRSSKDHRRAY